MQYRFFVLVFLIFAVLSCDDYNNSKEYPYGVYGIDNELYCETYKVYSGSVPGGDVYTVYLTDSVSVRKYLGKEMDYEQILVYKFHNNKVLSCKINTDTYKVKKTEIYDISELKKEGKFE